LNSKTHSQIQARIQALANPQVAAVLRRFFKTGIGEYGEGDLFLGIKVPPLRELSREFENVPLQIVRVLLKSKIHEERTLALMILVRQFTRADEAVRARIFSFYLSHRKFINNWDLVDGSAPYIVGPQLLSGDRRQLYALARSSSLWERRIAIVSTLYFIRQRDFDDALKISKLLLKDEHDLIHKAVGWMLREVGKRNLAVEEAFLKAHYRTMPRTMLRYAIERFPESRRKKYLLGKI